MIINNGAYPSPLNYRGFPKSICTSINNVACHGIPDNRPLKYGDIINVDVTVCIIILFKFNFRYTTRHNFFLLNVINLGLFKWLSWRLFKNI